MGERITTARAAELLAMATPGPWRGDCNDGTAKYAILAGDHKDPIVVLSVDHKNATYGFGCGYGDDSDTRYATNPSADESIVMLAPDLAADLIDARATIATLIAERDGWTETAARHCRNEDYYRGLVRQIGAAFPESYIADDDGKHDDALCAKVPEVVAATIAVRDAEVVRLRAFLTGLADNIERHNVNPMDDAICNQMLAECLSYIVTGDPDESAADIVSGLRAFAAGTPTPEADHD